MSKKFEGVPSDHEDESESEEENEEIQGDAGNGDWTPADYAKLVEQLRSVLPRKDTKKYQSTLKKIPWEQVAFDGHSADVVKAVTEELVEKVRKFRSMAEIVDDMEQAASKLSSAGKPKHPLSAYNVFVKEKYAAFKAKNPDMTSGMLLKLLSQEFSTLSDKKKQKYETMAAASKEQYKLELAQFYRDNPNAVPDAKLKKASSSRRRANKNPNTITPFGLFRKEKQQEMEEVTHLALRKLWEELEMSKKVKYIQKAFQSQSESAGGKLKLTKCEQSLLEVASGKPEPIPRTTSEYYLKHYAEPMPAMSLNEWRKFRLLEYKSLPKVRKLQLEIEFRHAKQEYVTKYQEYITNMQDEVARQTEIDVLKSFVATKLDKEEQQQLDNRPFHLLVESSNVCDMTVPIAESTTLNVMKDKKMKNKLTKKDAAAAPLAPPADLGSPITKPVKSILKSPAKKRPLVEIVSEPTPKKKKKASHAGNESDSNSEIKEKKPVVAQEIEEVSVGTNSSKAGSKKNGETTSEPLRPPKKFHYLGKDEKCEESFNKLSAHRKAAMRVEMRAAQKKYFKQLKKYLLVVPREKLEVYIKKLKKMESQHMKDGDTTDEESAKKVPKEEPDSDSSSSESNDEDEEQAEEETTGTTGTNGNNGNDEDDDDDDDSDDE
uniref:HMG box domain-containing protein n=1 Tax=Anopheles christyi TaxID=43041 RepID=A0A182KDP4_9DIPT